MPSVVEGVDSAGRGESSRPKSLAWHHLSQADKQLPTDLALIKHPALARPPRNITHHIHTHTHTTRARARARTHARKPCSHLSPQCAGSDATPCWLQLLRSPQSHLISAPGEIARFRDLRSTPIAAPFATAGAATAVAATPPPPLLLPPLQPLASFLAKK